MPSALGTVRKALSYGDLKGVGVAISNNALWGRLFLVFLAASPTFRPSRWIGT